MRTILLPLSLALLFLFACVNATADSEAEILRVTLLGTGTPAVRPERLGPATLIEAGGEYLLFDVGRGTTVRLVEAGVSPGQVTRLFITHLHSDHVIGLPDLWLSGWVLGRHESPLEIRGPAGSVALLESLRRGFEFDIRIRQEAGPKLPAAGIALAVEQIEPGVVYSENGVTVTAFAVDHGKIKPAYGFRVDFRDRSVVVSGDTRYSENLVEYSKGVDVLIHEVAYASETQIEDPFWRGVISTHTSPEQAARAFSATRPTLAVLNHIIAREPGNACDALRAAQTGYDGDILLGEDGMLIVINADGSLRVEGLSQTDCRSDAS